MAKYMNRQGIVKLIRTLFPTEWHSLTKFGVNQIFMSITMVSFSGVSWIYKIAAFSGDDLVKILLKLDKAINENAISTILKKLGQNDARKLQMLLLSKNARWVHESGLESITLDPDSTVKSVCGNQQGTAKGFNRTKKDSTSYHPLLVFVSEMKLLYYTLFRTDSAYTFNGIVDFLKEVEAILPKNITKVFYRADSGFFSEILLDLLGSFGWDYLIKVKLKNLVSLLEKQEWVIIDKQKNIAVCEFAYKAGIWEKTKILKAIRTVKENVEIYFFGGRKLVPVYQYACYVSTYELDAAGLYENYKQCSTSETWIEQVKGHAMAEATLAYDF